MIRAIAAVDDAFGIGKLGKLPWDIPADLKHFRKLTEYHTVLMGIATYHQFTAPLVNRRNVVVSRQPRQLRSGFELIHDVSELFDDAAEDIWIIGGATLYATTLKYCQELYVTRIAGDYTCDRFFPHFMESFDRIEASALQQHGGYQFYFEVYKRKKPARL